MFVVAVAPDASDALRRAALPCRVIADPEGRLLQVLGQPFSWWRLGRMPAALLVDAQGRVVWRHDGQSMRDTPAVSAWLSAVRRLQTT